MRCFECQGQVSNTWTSGRRLVTLMLIQYPTQSTDAWATRFKFPNFFLFSLDENCSAAVMFMSWPLIGSKLTTLCNNVVVGLLRLITSVTNSLHFSNFVLLWRRFQEVCQVLSDDEGYMGLRRRSCRCEKSLPASTAFVTQHGAVDTAAIARRVCYAEIRSGCAERNEMNQFTFTTCKLEDCAMWFWNDVSICERRLLWHEVFTAVKIKTVVFWVMKPRSLVGRYQRFGEAWCCCLQVGSLFYREDGYWPRRYLLTRLHSIINQKTVIRVFAEMNNIL